MISRAKTRQYAPVVLLFLLVLSLFLVACERPLGDDGQADAEPTATATADPNQGGGIDTEATEPVATEPPPETEEEDESAIPSDDPEEAITPEETIEEEATEEAAEPTEEAAGEAVEEPAEESAEEMAEEGAEEATEEMAEESTEEAAQEAAAEETEEAAAEAEATEAEADTGERTHIVQPGENLYRIGLQYGVSWVVLQDYNNLPSPNVIYVGQELRIPGDAEDDDTTTPPQTGDTYVVQAGDTLYSIGRDFGVDWREIATANNIVNPYRLFVGRELTIPTGSTTPPAVVTHTVAPGETLFLISLQYGVPWMSIADENNIEAPYVIYPGQELTIPAGT